MPNTVTYMVDEKGAKTAVLVPLKVWERINNDYLKLQNKIKVFKGIKNSLEEVKDAQKNGKELQTLNDFLCESKS